MRILWFNWRCIKHPLAGGAEVYTHEIARRLSHMGFDIILVSSRSHNLPEREYVDDYLVIRRGGKYTVYLEARRVYKELKKEGWIPDIVIDEVNTIPFMTPMFVKEPIVVLIHQLCKECWKYAIHPLFYPFGWSLEYLLHKYYVRKVREGKIKFIITVSEDTKNDLVKLGYPSDRIVIVPNGIDIEKYRECLEGSDESRENLVLYLGRITPYKRIEDLIKAWSIVEKSRKDCILIIAGRAYLRYLRKLEKLVRKFKLKNVKFLINISHSEKINLLKKAKILVYTSTREGYGQTIIEAAICGVIPLAYNVPGLREACRDVGGILLPENSPEVLAEYILKLLEAENQYKPCRRVITWDEVAERFLNILYEAVRS
ncbi:MAG: glycosyltransferase family 4 protein [Crenarchaeota archaeon]|nr:glycosyltransferase family 4 protein [Thermoproteota archaeon]